MSGDHIEGATFWAQYKSAAKLRGDVVHGGIRATAVQAEAAVEASQAFTTHIAQAAK